MYDYVRHARYFAQVTGGLERDGAAELLSLGAARAEPVHRGVLFEADRRSLYQIVYGSRLLGRVLAPLLRFRCRSPEALYRWTREVPFEDFFDQDETFSVHADVSGRYLTHSQYAALRVKDAIVDRFRDRVGRRPTVERQRPTVGFHLHVAGDEVTLSLDASGGALHRRGYRQRSVEAPMQETLAAAVVRESGWDGDQPLYDPFCGSGTLLAEALMKHARVPAGYLRERFGFERLPDFDGETWRAVRTAADQAIRQVEPGLLAGSDIDPTAVAAARQNLDRLPSGARVLLKAADFRSLDGLAGQVVLANPPYGIRLGDAREIPEIYRDFGDFLKRRAPGASAFVYVGDPKLAGHIGLRPQTKRPLVNGALDGRLLRFEIFAGNWAEQRRDPGE
ncbi:MAG: hypothetical protein JW751_16970 [Polyangiaceae bacterium]|nr:hypothetical protein [Polyangiaceae bacterium]